MSYRAPEGWVRSIAAAALAALGAVGCAEDRSDVSNRSERPLPSYTGVVSESEDGVLTNLPATRFLTSGDLVLTSAYLELSNFRRIYAVVVWADVENRGDRTLCWGFADMTLNGEEVGGLVYGAPFASTLGPSMPCLAPGDTGTLFGISLDLSEAAISPPLVLEYDVAGWVEGEPPQRHAAEPLLRDLEVAEVSGGWGVTGTVEGRAPVRDFEIDVFARDVSGLLFSDTVALVPTELGAGAELPFETEPVEVEATPIVGPFAGYVAYASFSDDVAGPDAAARVRAGEPERRYRSELGAARRRLRTLRGH